MAESFLELTRDGKKLYVRVKTVVAAEETNESSTTLFLLGGHVLTVDQDIDEFLVSNQDES